MPPRRARQFLSNPKEPKYFLTGDRPPTRGSHQGPGDAHSAREWIWRRERYERLFDTAPVGALKGESTPFYLWDRAAHRRIHALTPDAKLLTVVRDPIERAYSNWTHLWSDGLETEPDFVTACALEPRRAATGWAPFWRYLELGRYGEQLAHLFEVFDREQVYVLRYRELAEAPVQSLRAITTFLGVDSDVVSSVPASNMKSWADGGLLNTALRGTIRAGARAGARAHPTMWRHAQRPLVAALQRGNCPPAQ